ncbi:hypothetical protein TWF481_004015 [Arthrobotrys musiformis]|uniref:Mediator of RNA polymerase II transcription subunit 9 n=1 Tax=Arthrobotrys musiformis TaxID=47236 RepID=A0AAV9WJT9_9PEZI
MALVPADTSALAGPHPPTFPPPETFDFIPQTYDLLVRLLPQNSSSSSATTTTTTSPHAQTNLAPIEPKDVDAEASRIRLKIGKARSILNDLPDITRSIQQQQEEVKALEEKIRKQREVLGRIRELKAVKVAKEQQE